MGRELNRQQCVQAIGNLILEILIQVPVAIHRKDNTAYRSAVGVAFAAAVILVWMALAVGALDASG